MLQHTTDIEARLIMADWERQTKAISRAREAAGSSRGLRARLASHLAHLALAIRPVLCLPQPVPPGVPSGGGKGVGWSCRAVAPRLLAYRRCTAIISRDATTGTAAMRTSRLRLLPMSSPPPFRGRSRDRIAAIDTPIH